jgi:predicted MPP superfamily phosphohydrolase
MRHSPFWWILIGFMVLLDIYVFQVVKHLSQQAAPKTKLFIYSGYWVISVSAIIILLILPYLQFQQQSRIIKTTLFALIAGLFFAKLVASLFFLVDDVRRVIQWVSTKLFFSKTEVEAIQQGEGISRSAFLSWTGTLVGGGLFSSLLLGFGNKYRYQLRRVQLAFDNLPPAFKGMKIVQIADIHSGSLNDKRAVMQGIQRILDEKPDMIVFAGDLVNNVADEMEEYAELFGQLKAPMGVYSILGNHDYGDYVNWPDRDNDHRERERQEGRRIHTPLQQANLERLKQVHADMGWRLLLDEHVVVEKENNSLALIGVQNWSAKARFYKYGDLKKAYAGADKHPFKILLSHDPSHWDAEVKKHFPDIDLMLSGHTHGMQFGVELPGFKWSPVQYIYKQWAGLYEEGSQKLYVNRGFGFIGYPGRVGILPEITLIELT